LKRAGVALDAVAVKLEGADSGRLGQDLPELPYSQIVPMSKCISPESMVAFKLNDQFLPPKNGFPARALFPGWYGMDSVKWLRKIVVLGPDDKVPEFALSGMNKLYNRMAQSINGELKLTRVSEIQVRSVVSWPSPNVRLPVAKYFIRGFAWTGEGTIRSVAVSTDGGRKWAPAELETKPKPFTWVQWRWPWSPLSGDYTVLSRAMDDSGREQPILRDPARKDGYELNFCAPVRCEVR
jgi:DMSO/TMAO reductase YedYZ molybdopterin-dependent catalytic subunit